MLSMRMSGGSNIENGIQTDNPRSGCDPMSPDDVAEVIVFASSRRENVVIADTLVFPSHQVRVPQTARMQYTNLIQASAMDIHRRNTR